MVRKIKIIILFIIPIILCFLNFLCRHNIETNLLKTLLPEKIVNSSDIIPIANKSSSLIKVVFSAKDETELDELKSNFIKQIDKNYFEYDKPDVSELLELYKTKPDNFLSDNARKLLKGKKYDDIYKSGIEMLYNPAMLQIVPFDEDPYFLFNDFILSSNKYEAENYFEDTYYDFLALRIKTQDGLSPDLSNKKISELVKIQKKLSNNDSKIYLAGTPVHSYHTSKKSIISINIICILSILLIALLTYFYFKKLEHLIPILISILYGMLLGYSVTGLWFNDFQIITMVFSTTLIGIGIDYSCHYFFADKIDKTFIKNLSFSFLTTIIPFILLYLTGIELLKQIAVFTVFGLFGIYIIVLFLYPDFKLTNSDITIKINKNIYKASLAVLFFLSILGCIRFNVNDSLSAFYNPSGKLKKAEILYDKISGLNQGNTQFITVKGHDFQNILENEEMITDKLAENNIEYLSLSKFIPSKKRQNENSNLVKMLYNQNLQKYSDILSTKQIKILKEKKFSFVDFNIDNYPYLKGFMLNKNTSLILVSSNQTLNFLDKNTNIINIKTDIASYLKEYRKILLFVFPVSILILAIFLSILYDFKKSIKLLTPSLTGIAFAVCLTCLINGELNLFSIITIFLILGFTLDYSIFRLNKGSKTEDAVFVSCITTSFSFILLILSGFKLLSSMSLMLFFGIIVSYMTGYLLFLKQE